MVVDAGPAPLTVDVLGDRPDATGPLMVRNASPDGSSVATLIAVNGLAVAAHDDWPTSLSRPGVVAGWGRAYSTLGVDLADKARLRRFDALTAPIDVRWGDGLRVRIVPNDQLSRAVYRSGTYEPHTLRVLQAALSPGDVFLDIGANAGVVALAAAAWVGPRAASSPSNPARGSSPDSRLTSRSIVWSTSARCALPSPPRSGGECSGSRHPRAPA